MKYLFLLSLVVWIAYADIESLDFRSDNKLVNVQVKDSKILQGNLHIYESNIYESNIVLSSEFKNSMLDLGSIVYQNRVILNNSSMEESTIIAQSSIDRLLGHQVIIKQSVIDMKNESSMQSGSEIILNNTIQDVKMNQSLLSQGEVYLNNTVLNDVRLLSKNRFFSRGGDSVLASANVVQGTYIMHNSDLSNSTIDTKSILVDTKVDSASLEICGTYINGGRLSNVHLKKSCFMKDSKITNGANLVYGISRI